MNSEDFELRHRVHNEPRGNDTASTASKTSAISSRNKRTSETPNYTLLTGYWFTRVVLLRALAVVYCMRSLLV